jgi:hypothetical protein
MVCGARHLQVFTLRLMSTYEIGAVERTRATVGAGHCPPCQALTQMVTSRIEVAITNGAGNEFFEPISVNVVSAVTKKCNTLLHNVTLHTLPWRIFSLMYKELLFGA